MVDTQPTTFRLYAEVIVNSNINKTLDYGLPATFEHLCPGTGVMVPLKGSDRVGVIHTIKDSTKCQQVLPISGLIDSRIVLSEDLMQLMKWMSQYYFSPLGKTLRLFLPHVSSQTVHPKQQYYVSLAYGKTKTKRQILELEKSHPAQANVLKTLLSAAYPISLSSVMQEARVSSSPIHTLEKQGLVRLTHVFELQKQEHTLNYFSQKRPQLLPEQIEALDKITSSLTSGFRTHLLFGVTGSGKTEVYLQAIERTLALGKRALMLVPEIALTLQTETLFRARFGKQVGILHHQLSHSEKSQTWIKAFRGEISIVIGPRSALFCPIKHLGLIVVDEEHDPAYKQHESHPCYHARDVAVMRGKLAGATVVLGSASPSIESYTNALAKKYVLSLLSKRAATSCPTQVQLIDMNLEREKSKTPALFSSQVISAIEKRLQLGEQIIVFFNRRGFHTNVSCSACKYTLLCPHCDMILTFHKHDQALLCHLCNYTIDQPQTICPKCEGSMTLQYRGSGTEKVETILQSIFPKIRTIRIDSDTTKHRGNHDKLLRQFATGKADVLIGTQMIAKGMHFPSVTLAVILNGDSGLYIPDFRAAEQVFQLILQVSGRAGREGLPGEVLIQTFLPQNATIRQAIAQDFASFYQYEMEGRKLCHYPPFTRLIRCIFLGKDEKKTYHEAKRVYTVLTNQLANSIIMPVSPCGHFKIRGNFRYQFLIKSPQILHANKALHEALLSLKLSSKVKIVVDVDPVSTFF